MYDLIIQCYSDNGIYMKNNRSITTITDFKPLSKNDDYIVGSKVSYLAFREKKNLKINNLYFRKSNFEIFKLNFQLDVLCVCHPKHLADIRVEDLIKSKPVSSHISISDVDKRGNRITYDPNKHKHKTLAIVTKEHVYIYNYWTIKSLQSYLISQGFTTLIETAYINKRFLLGYHSSGYVALTNKIEKKHTSFLRFKSTPKRIRESFSNVFNFNNQKKKTELFEHKYVGLCEPTFGWIFFYPFDKLTFIYRKRNCDNIPLSKTNYVIIADNIEYISTIRDRKEMEQQLNLLNIKFKIKRTHSKEIFSLNKL